MLEADFTSDSPQPAVVFVFEHVTGSWPGPDALSSYRCSHFRRVTFFFFLNIFMDYAITVY